MCDFALFVKHGMIIERYCFVYQDIEYGIYHKSLMSRMLLFFFVCILKLDILLKREIERKHIKNEASNVL